MPGLFSSQQYELPAHAAHGELRGWRVMVVFERVQRGARGRSARSRLMWYDGFVVDTRMVPGPAGAALHVRALFRDGYEDWWHGFPDRTFSFSKASEPDRCVSPTSLSSGRTRLKC